VSRQLIVYVLLLAAALRLLAAHLRAEERRSVARRVAVMKLKHVAVRVLEVPTVVKSVPVTSRVWIVMRAPWFGIRAEV
jgi:hypothetical protein